MRRLMMAAAALAALGGGPAVADDEAGEPLLSDVRQLTFEGRRAGEGYFGPDGRRMVFQSERHPGNPFYQMYLLDLETGETQRVSPGVGKTTCGWIRPDGEAVLFASTHADPEAEAKQQAELDFRASGKERRYSWDFDPHYDLWRRDLRNGGYTRLTEAEGYDAEGAYSPDGDWIVFASNRQAYARELSAKERKIFEHDKSYFMDLYRMNTETGAIERLTETPGYDGGPFFSFDGGRIVWRRFSEDGARAEIWVMNADGTDKRRITDLGVVSWAPFFHPSGDYIIFATNKHGYGNFELYLVDAAGKKEPVRVTHTEGFDGLPVFAPDGRRLSWSSTRTSDGTSQIFLADWDDAAAREALGLPPKAERARPLPRPEETAPAITEADLRMHVETLTGKRMAGRLTGTKGEKIATAYVGGAFQRLGLRPAGADGSYFQPFTFTAGVSLGDGNRLTLEGVDGAPDPRVDETWRPLAFSAVGDRGPAPVVFAGHGIQAPADDGQEAHDSYAGLDVEGKWVLIHRGLPQDLSPDRKRHLTRYAELPYKAATARRQGAAGLIVAPAPGVDYRDDLVRLRFDAAAGTSGLAAFSVDRATAEAIRAALPRVRVAATIDIVRETRQGRNVLARLDTGAPDDAPVVMVGAHVDHLGHGETSGSLATEGEAGAVHPGADDNASGVAAMLEIAEDLVRRQRTGRLPAKRDIVFAAWSGEELGLLGSAHYAKARLAEIGGDSLAPLIAAYLNMDMVGRLRDRLTLFGAGSSPVWEREIERRNVPVGLPIATKRDSYLPTDATTFYLKGVPVLHAFTGVHSEYSTPRDTRDTLNYAGLRKVARLIGGIAGSLAERAEPPAYVEQAAPKNEGGRQRSTVYLGTIPDYAAEGVEGLRLSGTAKGGPAAEAGLRAGDVVVRLGGTAIGNIYDFVSAMNGLTIGQPTEVVVLRDGARRSLTLVPAARE